MAKNDMQHERDRIEQFRREAGGNAEVFEKKILNRAFKSSPEKRERFATALDASGDKELAQKVRTASTLTSIEKS